MKTKKPDIRFLYDMKKVLFDQKWLKKAKNVKLYEMYRGVKKKGELRYDITIIPSLMLGKEFVKTAGHFQKSAELYKVLQGEAIFLIQKCDKKIVEDVFAVKAKRNDAVIVPSFYGHVAINPKKEELKIANWVSEKCKNIYTKAKLNKGFCYFYTESGWVKNENYKKVPKLRFEKPLKKMPKNLEFLKIRSK